MTQVYSRTTDLFYDVSLSTNYEGTTYQRNTGQCTKSVAL